MSPTDGTHDGDEYGFLRDPVLAERSRRADVEQARAQADARVRARRRRRKVVAAVLGIGIAAAVGGIARSRLPSRRDRSADVEIHTTPPPTPTTVRLISENPVPPAASAPFPVTSVGDARVLRHSGGPYVSRSRVTAMVLAQLQCTLGHARRDMPGFVCARVDVAYFDRYADAWKLRGARWAFVHAWGADREMYAVTVWGRLASDIARPATNPLLTEITTVEIDATTGQTMMEGGPPLPATDANR